jgi:hypothetical protein
MAAPVDRFAAWIVMKRASALASENGEVYLDRLLGRVVLARNNQSVGRLEDCRVEKHGQVWAITEYVIGAGGLLERLGVGLRLVLGLRPGGYVARWDQLDISDPERPRLICGIEDLRPLIAPETTKSGRSS